MPCSPTTNIPRPDESAAAAFAQVAGRIRHGLLWLRKCPVSLWDSGVVVSLASTSADKKTARLATWSATPLLTDSGRSPDLRPAADQRIATGWTESDVRPRPDLGHPRWSRLAAGRGQAAALAVLGGRCPPGRDLGRRPGALVVRLRPS